MAEPLLTPADVLLFAPELGEEKAQALIDDAIAWALMYAPCIASDDFTNRNAAKAIIRRAILREKDSGQGAVQSQQRTAGPYGFMQTVDTRSRQGESIFTDTEQADLARLCGTDPGNAFSIMPNMGTDHEPV